MKRPEAERLKPLRLTIIRNRTPCPTPANRIAHLGSRLAERLNLPFLHHATAAHRAEAKIEGRRRRDALRN